MDAEVRALAARPDGTSVYVGGKFNRIDARVSSKLARLEVATWAPVPGFDAGLVDAAVFDVELAGDRLIVAGYFTTIRGTPRSRVAELDPAIGAVGPGLALEVSGTAWGGATAVTELDVTPDGSRMVMIGTFRTVGAAERVQIAMVDLTTSPASVTDWSTERYDIRCGRSRNVLYDLRDVDFSPDGSYFVTVATVGWLRPMRSATPPRAGRRTGPVPTAAHVDCVHGQRQRLLGRAHREHGLLGGHFRWFNNPDGVDLEGPGAVGREGIAALDPANGLPLTWNPGRARGRAGWDMVATPDALYVGSDTDRIGGFVPRARRDVPAGRRRQCRSRRHRTSPWMSRSSRHASTPADWSSARVSTGEPLDRLTPAPVGAPGLRAALVAEGWLYAAHDNGTLVRYSLSGDIFSDPTVVDGHGLEAFSDELTRMTSMFRVGWDDDAPVPNSRTRVSGPALDGIDGSATARTAYHSG